MTTKNTKANKAQASKAQAQAQANVQAKRTRTRKTAQANNTYGVVGTYTYTGEHCPESKLGKKVPSVKVATRFRSCDFATMRAIARMHNGSYSMYAQEWLFDTTANAKAFASDIDKAVAEGKIVVDPTNLARKKDRKAAGLREHTDEWYAARAKRQAKATAPAKQTSKKSGTKDMEKMFKAFMAFMQANA